MIEGRAINSRGKSNSAISPGGGRRRARQAAPLRPTACVRCPKEKPQSFAESGVELQLRWSPRCGPPHSKKAIADSLPTVFRLFRVTMGRNKSRPLIIAKNRLVKAAELRGGRRSPALRDASLLICLQAEDVVAGKAVANGAGDLRRAGDEVVKRRAIAGDGDAVG